MRTKNLITMGAVVMSAVLLGTSAIAQVKEPADLNSIADQLEKRMGGDKTTLSTDPAEIAKDADTLYQFCVKQQMYAAFNDCECVRDRYIEERKQGKVKSADPSQATNATPPSACPNAGGAKAYAYETCGHQYANKIRSGREEFCACYSEELVKTHMREPRSAMDSLTRYGAGAIAACDARGLPSPMNPDRTVAGGSTGTDSEVALNADGFEPLPEGFCRSEGRQRYQVERYRSCQAVKNPEQFNNSRPGYKINVKYHHCMYTGLRDEPNHQMVRQDCEKRYGPHWIETAGS